MTQSDVSTLDRAPQSDFNPDLSIAVADTWWDLGRKLAPFIGESASAEQQTAFLRDWVASIQKDEDDTDVIEAVTPAALRDFVDTTLRLLERKFDGEHIADDVRDLIASAHYEISDLGQRLLLKQTPESFWAWEYLYLFSDMDSTYKSDWMTAAGRCADCNVFFVRTRSDQRFHSDACRKRAANLRFYRSDKAKTKRQRK